MFLITVYDQVSRESSDTGKMVKTNTSAGFPAEISFLPVLHSVDLRGLGCLSTSSASGVCAVEPLDGGACGQRCPNCWNSGGGTCNRDQGHYTGWTSHICGKCGYSWS